MTDGVPELRELTETRSRLPFYRFPIELNMLFWYVLYIPNAHIGYFISLRSHGAWGESQVAMMRTVQSAEGFWAMA